MALMDCIECGRQISDRAISCPQCGVPVILVRSEIPPIPRIPPIPPIPEIYVDAGRTKSRTSIPVENQAAEVRPSTGSDFSTLKFRQTKHARNKSRNYVPIFILFAVAGCLWIGAYKSFPRLLSAIQSQSSSYSESGTSVTSAVGDEVLGMSEEEKDKCSQKLEMYIKIAAAEARFIGEQRAIEKGLKNFESNADRRCKAYIAEQHLNSLGL